MATKIARMGFLIGLAVKTVNDQQDQTIMNRPGLPMCRDSAYRNYVFEELKKAMTDANLGPGDILYQQSELDKALASGQGYMTIDPDNRAYIFNAVDNFTEVDQKNFFDLLVEYFRMIKDCLGDTIQLVQGMNIWEQINALLLASGLITFATQCVNLARATGNCAYDLSAGLMSASKNTLVWVKNYFATTSATTSAATAATAAAANQEPLNDTTRTNIASYLSEMITQIETQTQLQTQPQIQTLIKKKIVDETIQKIKLIIIPGSLSAQNVKYMNMEKDIDTHYQISSQPESDFLRSGVPNLIPPKRFASFPGTYSHNWKKNSDTPPNNFSSKRFRPKNVVLRTYNIPKTSSKLTRLTRKSLPKKPNYFKNNNNSSFGGKRNKTKSSKSKSKRRRHKTKKRVYRSTRFRSRK